MLEELAMRDHASLLPALLLVLDVLIPKSVVVIVIVAWDERFVFERFSSLDFVDSCVLSRHKVNEDIVRSSFELVLVDVLLLAHNTITLLHSLIVFRAADYPLNQLACVELCALFVVHATSQQIH